MPDYPKVKVVCLHYRADWRVTLTLCFQVVKKYYCISKNCEGRFPVFYIHITVPTAELDVNVDPNKTRVMLHQQVTVLKHDMPEI